ncbi:hypothetical protein CTheo_2224 [Ceratobasidium theobromae]|uniref:Lipid droplet-associated perilipin protein n=1 Tax=Ceratobasidium theobromae TaxID=1582974 RepID=A0A5N5QRF8_9AGAM|nr:hypothetical protein CTheo_2224 [Ceratobasidium theobromae]
MAETQSLLTSVDRVGRIPLVNDTLSTLNTLLSQNTYSKGIYSTAQAYGERAYSLSQPVQVRLAPVIVRVDGYANMGLDALESRWPYPFQASTEEVIDTLKQGPDAAYGIATAYANAASKAYEDRVKTPAYELTLTPIVDRFEIVVNKFHKEALSSSASSCSSSSSDSEGAAERQYVRAYRLSLDLKDQILLVSSEQLKQIQQNNVYIQRATESLHNLTNSISSLSHGSSTRAHQLSQSVLAELESIQQLVHSRKEALPGQYASLKEAVGATLTEVRGIVHETNVPVGEKAVKVRDAVIGRVQPVLQQVIEEGKKLIGRAMVKGEEATEQTKEGVQDVKENGVSANGST